MEKIEVKNISNLKRSISVEIGGERFQKDKETLYKKIGKNLKVPGFRTGTAPLGVLERYYNKFLKEEFIKRMVPVYYKEILEKENLSPVGVPHIYQIEVKEKAIKFSVDLEVKPNFKVEEQIYKGIKVRYKKKEVSEKEIEKVLSNWKEELKKVVKKELTDEEIAKWMGYPDFTSFYDAVELEILLDKLSQEKIVIEEQVKKHLLKKVKITEVPSGVVEKLRQELLQRELDSLKARGVPQEDIDKYKNNIEEKVKEVAKEQVRLFYILETIARQENLEITYGRTIEVVMGYILSQAQYIVE